MLTELRVRDLGVIGDVTVDLAPGMTALTGETGAGKTLLVEALELLVGGRAERVLVRPGADEALVEGRFELDGAEVVLARAVAARGRSRAWVDGRMAPLSALVDAGRQLLDLHGQHAHQSLLQGAAQRHALDVFAGVDLGPLREVKDAVREVEGELASLGGDDRARAREADLLRYQLDEIDGAAIRDANEDAALAGEETRLGDLAAHRQAAAEALAGLAGDPDLSGAGASSVVDLLGDVSSRLGSSPVLDTLRARIDALQAEAADVAVELRVVVDTWEEDPERLDAVRRRRQLLRDLRRKYGEDLAAVLAYARDVRTRLSWLASVDERGQALQARRRQLADEQDRLERSVGRARRAGAPQLAAAVEGHLRNLAMSRARLEVQVADADPGDDVSMLLGANPGEPLLALAKVASGGELARAMLALRLVLTGAPPTLVFDEVDAGIGGEAAVAVGRALAEVARRHQVLVVTHLAQVAAFADQQLAVTKSLQAGRTVSTVEVLGGDRRVVELARMLSGRPDSPTARRHAEELLAGANTSPR